VDAPANLRRITATAPVRIADVGGWTDTWFAGEGAVCSLAVEPGARVDMQVGSADGPITLVVGSTGERYAFVVGDRPDRHPLLESAIARLPLEVSATIVVDAAVPPGSGMGTSASVVVALLGALQAARGGPELTGDELAATAHDIELELGRQSGVQDQWAAAHGGANLFEVTYPDVRRRVIDLDPELRSELDRRLVTVYLGQPHTSSAIHEQVISRLATVDPGPTFVRLRSAAAAAASSLAQRDLDGFGRAMIEHHEAVRALHQGLISRAADAVVAIARGCGATGWKANGAAGDGGSVTVVGPDSDFTRWTMIDALRAVGAVEVLDHRISSKGVTVVDRPTAEG
jgi:D-glycero-alpha-D-manno-heptose-7-phosphate kinase